VHTAEDGDSQTSWCSLSSHVTEESEYPAVTTPSPEPQPNPQKATKALMVKSVDVRSIPSTFNADWSLHSKRLHRYKAKKKKSQSTARGYTVNRTANRRNVGCKRGKTGFAEKIRMKYARLNTKVTERNATMKKERASPRKIEERAFPRAQKVDTISASSALRRREKKIAENVEWSWKKKKLQLDEEKKRQGKFLRRKVARP
jgi:hypothetical protein